MDDLKPQRRPFQFSLRKALLWTAVWSVYLDWVRWAGMLLSTAVSVTLCLVALLVVRIKWGFDRGFLITLVITGLAVASLVASDMIRYGAVA